MRLYIPTSSLNADSILSCECIAPASVCISRTFGYSHFVTLDVLNQFNGYTLAFTKVPQFSIVDASRENYPMIVEIELPDIKVAGLVLVGEVNGTAIYATSNPLPITPANSRLLFFNPKELEYTYHNCADSAKCKLFDSFKYNFASAATVERGESIQVYIASISRPSHRQLYSENSYDKVKGFIWGFGMGSLLSLSPDVANLLRIQKRVYDIISSIKNEDQVSQSLNKELEILDKEYSKLDPIQLLAKSKWNNYIKEIASTLSSLSNVEIIDVDTLLKLLGVETEAKGKFLREQGLRLRKPLRSYSLVGTYGYEQYNAELVEYTRSIIHDDMKNRLSELSLNDKLDVDTDKYETVMLSFENEDSALFNSFIIQVIWDNIIPSLEELRINRSEVARNAVITIKSIIEAQGKVWQGSDIQTYFDHMRKNISKYEPFDLNEIDNLVIKSIAAFILKGEDIESLKTYLDKNAISDCRYAFALWGGLTGYVSITRALLDMYLNKFEKIALFNAVQKVMNPNMVLRIDPIEKESIQQPITISSAESIHDTYTKRVLEFFDTKVRKSKNTVLLRRGLIETLQILEEAGQIENGYLLVTSLDNKPGWDKKPRPMAWIKLKEEFCPDYEAQVGGLMTSESKLYTKSASMGGFIDNVKNTILYNLFSEQEQNVIPDNNKGLTSDSASKNTEVRVRKISFDVQNIKLIATIIKELNPELDEFANKQIVKDLMWLFDPQFSDGKSEMELLEIFRSILISGKNDRTSKKGKDMTWKNKAYRSLDIEYTIQFFREHI